MISFGRLSLLCGLILALLPQLAAAQQGPLLVKRWDFNTPGDPEGWAATHGLADMTAAQGHLRMKTTDADGFMVGPPVQAPLDGCVVRVAQRCQHSSDTQVYWLTSDYAQFGEQQVVTLHALGYGTLNQPVTPGHPTTAPTIDAAPFTVLEFVIGKAADAGRTLTRIRVDPCNGVVGGMVDIDYIEIVRLPPVVQARLSFDHHHVAIDQPANLSLRLIPAGGRKGTTSYTAQLPGGSMPATPSASQPAATFGLRFENAGVHRPQMLVTSDKSTRYDLETSIIVGTGDTLPLTTGLRTGRARLDFIYAADGKHVGAARWMAADKAGDWHLGGWLLPLVQLIVQQPDGKIVVREPALNLHMTSPQAARLDGFAPDLPDWRVQIDFAILPDRNDSIPSQPRGQAIQVTALLSGPPSGQLLGFTAPILRADRDPAGDPLDRFGLFGGLEMLEPGWRSSSERAVGEKFAARWAPRPFKVSLPAMAIEAGGLTTGLFWQPLDAWDGPHVMPTATFASPDFLSGQSNHLMSLSVPSIPDWADENEAYARRPYVMKNAEPLTLRALLYAECDLPMAMVARRWYEAQGTPTPPLGGLIERQVPPPPPEARTDKDFYNLVARCYGETLYDAKRNGWTLHWFLPGQQPAFYPEIAAFLLAHATDTGDTTWVERTKLKGRPIIDAAGTLASRVAADGHAKGLINSMRPDGTWAFRNTEQMRKLSREFTNGKYDSLGSDGATTLGTCAEPALTILRSAKMTGDPQLTAAGLKALQAMRQFRIPRGSQTWEVPLEIPDILAASRAVTAYRIAYELTGDPRHLDDATYWSWTGVPFLYAWRVPAYETAGTMIAGRDRDDPLRESIPLPEVYQNGYPQVTPYGSLPVLGPSFYAVNWFGVLVQWCGIDWAEAVIELDEHRPDPLLRYIADGVVLSGMQQMIDKPPWIGLFPDSWLLDRNISQVALIYPGYLLKCRQAQGRLPRWSEPWTRLLRDETGERRWHVSGWGQPIELGRPGLGPWTATIRFLPGQPNELVMAGVPAPRLVLLGNELLPTRDESHASQRGWHYDPARHLLLARFEQSEKDVRVKVEW